MKIKLGETINKTVNNTSLDKHKHLFVQVLGVIVVDTIFQNLIESLRVTLRPHYPAFKSQLCLCHHHHRVSHIAPGVR